jgi:hypothetical protein
MLRRKRSRVSRQTGIHIEEATELLQAEVRRLTDLVSALQAESAAHIRRFGELQLELDRLKRATYEPVNADTLRLTRRPRDGAA